MSLWRGKQEQQNVFDEVAQGICCFKCVGINSQNDGNLFVKKVVKYVGIIPKGALIIDVGCGIGTLFHELRAQNVPALYYLIGIDISTASAKVAKKRNGAAEFIVCDIERLPFREKISEMVIVRNVLHHLPTLGALDNLARLLSSNGLLLMDDKINGNPLQEILFAIYPLMPYRIKMVLRDKDNHIDKFGNLPSIKRYNPKEYLKFFRRYKDNLTILETEYHGFLNFLNILMYISNVLPRSYAFKFFIEKLNSRNYHNMFLWSAVSMTVVLECSKPIA